jgi:hypothetical protein
MVRPRLTDDGRTVVLDLHGASVDGASELIRRVSALASGRGRGTLRVVHGTSTSDPLARNRTIRHALHDLLDAGELRPFVVDAVRDEGHTLLALAPGTLDRRRLSSADLGL